MPNAVPAAAPYIWSDDLAMFPEVVRITGQHDAHMQVVDSAHGGPCETVRTMFSIVKETRNVPRESAVMILDVI